MIVHHLYKHDKSVAHLLTEPMIKMRKRRNAMTFLGHLVDFFIHKTLYVLLMAVAISVDDFKRIWISLMVAIFVAISSLMNVAVSSAFRETWNLIIQKIRVKKTE